MWQNHKHGNGGCSGFWPDFPFNLLGKCLSNRNPIIIFLKINVKVFAHIAGVVPFYFITVSKLITIRTDRRWLSVHEIYPSWWFAEIHFINIVDSFDISHICRKQNSVFFAHLNKNIIYTDCTAAQRTDRQNRYLRNAGNGKAQNSENCYLLPICRLSRNTADRKRMGILPSRHKTGSCGWIYPKEYIGIKTVRKKQKEQAYRLLENITEIKKSSVHNLNPLWTLEMARCKGFEPLTFWFVAKHSIQLS